MYRTWVLRSQMIPSAVERHPNNLSRIIGLMWQGLTNEERWEWYGKATSLRLEYKNRNQGRSYTPAVKGGAVPRRRSGRVPPDDRVRHEKIAVLVNEGKQGVDLAHEVEIFDASRSIESPPQFRGFSSNDGVVNRSLGIISCGQTAQSLIATDIETTVEQNSCEPTLGFVTPDHCRCNLAARKPVCYTD
ncbi:hypothetical protein HGRIS_001638 [Hohenbuehelia grisea]|uniref:HMG box domain-containing protein n=1 Tax=Hohenbuehelia grisea TaxID=104357 RepID=A0ABR3JJR2_9AGAR